MRKSYIFTIGAILCAVLFVVIACRKQQNEPSIDGPADVLVLGNIITVDTTNLYAEAMTIKNGLVQFVGTEAEARKHCDTRTKEIKYGSASVYPGFMEAHCHGNGAGLVEESVKLFDGQSYAQYQDMLRAYVQAHPEKEEYRISGWSVQGTVPPTKALLDEVCADKPMYGASMDGHCFLLNQLALDKFHVDKAFAEKYGTDMAPVDSAGNPTGYLCEAAAQDLMKKLPNSVAQIEKYILAWQDMAFSNGYVAACEAGVNMQSEYAHQAYLNLANSNQLKLRTRAFYNVVQDQANEETVQAIVRMKKECKNDYYKMVGVKLFIDGVVESHTALLVDDYSDKPGMRGLNRYPDTDILKNLVLTAHRNGLPTHTHTIGDGAVRYMLDAIEYAKSTTGDYSVRDMLAHVELVQLDDIDRFAKNNVSAIVAALWMPKNSITKWDQEVELMGVNRCINNYCLANSFVKKGVNVAQHTDYPVSQGFNVTKAIYCGLTRCLPGDGGANLRNADECVSRLEMLRELTINVAYLWNEEDRMGTLTPGKLANYVVYDVDFMRDDLEKIPNAQLQQVVIDGVPVYGDVK